MKPLKNMFALTAVIAVMLIVWLMPKINTAKNSTYVRVYEDTDVKDSSETKNKKEVKQPEVKKEFITGNKVSAKKETTPKPSSKKIYKKEELKVDSSRSFKKVKMSMYSRAIHFRPEEEIAEAIPLPADTTAPAIP